MSGNSSNLGRPTIAILPPLPESEPSTSAESIPTSQQQQNNNYPLPNNSNSNSNSNGLLPNPDISSPRLSSSWTPDSQSNYCTSCQSPFDPLFKRKHHCRLCGNVFCDDCSNTRSLIPPSALVLRTKNSVGPVQVGASFNSLSNSDQGDASITYVSNSSSNITTGVSSDDDTLLYGRGLERRILLARTPQRTCHPCREQLAPLQNELCLRNSNSMRYNYIDEGDAIRRLCNSPLAFTLGHEVRKAAYALGNLLPGNKSYTGSGGIIRSGGFVPTVNESDLQYSYPPPEADPCHVPNGGCKTIDPTLRNVDKLHIPARLLQRARGVAIVTSCKGGLGFAGFEFGTGLVVARRQGDSDNLDDWSAPSAIGIAGFAWGALVGAQVSDHVFLLMTDDAVRLFSSDKGKSIQLGADVGVALGPLGRSAEADIGATSSVSRSLDGSYGSGGVALAPIYTYSLSKGLVSSIAFIVSFLMLPTYVSVNGIALWI